MTLNQIVTTLKRLGAAHAQLNTVSYGNAFDILDTDNLYPLLFITLPTPSIQSKQLTYTFSFWFLDRVLQENSNAEEVESDMMEIAKDYFAMLNDPQFEWEGPGSATFTQLFDRSTADWLGGVRMDVSVNIPFAWNRCSVPLLGGNFLLIDDENYLLINTLNGRLKLT